MKKTLTLLAALSLAAVASAAAPVETMKTGQAPITILPRYLPAASEATAATESPVKLEKFTVTGSMLPKTEAKQGLRSRARR